ncbi:hypothetical protein COCVIDRAFT_37223 [Bipolaris victoriae FI3]|uniref:Uncharacterized protein n=1 Tax=Bipolaris victoriae (strain FI3) TaxID=930091 RepID=W7EBC1_BIPV3|nr:hypothetical protein COCVIDRAFT_37223 [Bipolaris victoriae FI3]
MGRAGYDTTYVCTTTDSAATTAIAMADAQRAKDAKTAEQAVKAATEAKLIKNKHSRGIVAARLAMQERTTSAATKKEGEAVTS